MKEANKMFHYNMTVEKSALCWLYNASDKLKVNKNLEDNHFQVFICTNLNREEMLSQYGHWIVTINEAQLA